jgi:hypothetical protein
VGSSCSTSGTRRITPVAKTVMNKTYIIMIFFEACTCKNYMYFFQNVEMIFFSNLFSVYYTVTYKDEDATSRWWSTDGS